jgi:hypothetical protein
MIENLQILLLIIAGIIGTATAVTLGWSESTEPLNTKKLASSFIRGTIGITVYIAGTYTFVDAVNIWDYVIVAVFAAGFDALIKRGQGALTK